MTSDSLVPRAAKNDFPVLECAQLSREHEGVELGPDDDRRDGYSVVLFAAHATEHRHPPASLVNSLLGDDRISSIQATFHEDKPAEQHAMPPGGFRLAIVNCFDLQAGQDARRRLGAWFWEHRTLKPRHRSR